MEKENNVPVVNLQEVEIFQPEFLNLYSEEELEEMDMQLSEKEEGILKEILEIENAQGNEPNLMEKLLEAVKKGSLDYLDSMTDTGNTFDHMKDRSSKLDDVEIIKKQRPADPEKIATMQSRTMNDARTSPFDKNTQFSTNGMSGKGAKILQKEVEAYRQRTKSVTSITMKDKSVPYKSDQRVNLESLSGLRSYRLGGCVKADSPAEFKQKYEDIVSQGGTIDNVSTWIRQENFSKFYNSMMDKYGFKSPSAAKTWLRENNLVIHETSDGMIIVPQDVHDKSPHSGYCSTIRKLLTNEITLKEANDQRWKERIDLTRHETVERGTRMIRGIGMTAMKDLLKCGIIVVVDETLIEFKEKNEDKFVIRMWRVLKNTWQHIKNKYHEIIANLWKNVRGSILNEFLTLLNDFFFKTFKNIFKVVRQMFSSIKSAFKIIFSKNSSISMEEKIFEASKVLSAGVASLIGFSLNELIEKGLTSIGFPLASFIAECLSGLFSGILSAVVLMLFDSLKSKFLVQSPAVQKMQLQANAVAVKYARVSISALKVDMKMLETYNLFGNVIVSITDTRKDIFLQRMIAAGLHSEVEREIEKQNSLNIKIQKMIEEYGNEES